MPTCPSCGLHSNKSGTCEKCLRKVLDESSRQKKDALQKRAVESRPTEHAFRTVLLCLPALLLSSIFVAYNQKHQIFLSLVLAVNFSAWMIVIVSAMLLMFFLSSAGVSLQESGDYLKKHQPKLFLLHLSAIGVGVAGTVLWACFVVRDFLNSQTPLIPGQ